MTVGDFNNDTKLDIVVTNDHDATVSILLGNGNETFQDQKTYKVDQYPSYVIAGDFNNDVKLHCKKKGYINKPLKGFRKVQRIINPF